MADDTGRPGALLADYRPLAGTYDECLSTDGAMRPAWRPLWRALETMGGTTLQQRHREAVQLFRQNGVTYGSSQEPAGPQRPWSFDPVPMLMGNEEWGRLERGLVQRAEFFNLLLEDLYGAQRCIAEGVLPPAVLHASPDHLPPCRGLRLPFPRQLVFYACSVARAPGGGFTALGDHTRLPLGVAYALENRMVLARVFPELYRDCQVQRLSRFFRASRRTLAELAPQGGGNPFIVLLSPGPDHESYFEQAYLANHLGFPLVEGRDLTVREHKVYLKTLAGLQRVDVILRHVEDRHCDPLELTNDSRWGVAGLLQAVRRGGVSIANPLGCTVLENPALRAFLQPLCRFFLGEDPLLPSLATWWCGQPREREHVIANLERLVLRAIHAPRARPIVVGRLALAEREKLVAALRREPHLYAAEEPFPLSTVPTLEGGAFLPQGLVLRCFLSAGREGYSAMPGGLARVHRHPGDETPEALGSWASKDTWVISAAPEETSEALMGDAKHTLKIDRRGSGVSSRIAENLFWFGRYMERADRTARLLREAIVLFLQQGESRRDAALAQLLRSFYGITRIPPPESPAGADGAPDARSAQERELLRLILDAALEGSLLHDVQAMASAAGAVRDRISSEMMRIVNDIVDGLERIASPAEAVRQMESVTLSIAAIAGLSMDSMTHTEEWRFLSIGRRLERALWNVALMRASAAEIAGANDPYWETLLRIQDSIMTYRWRYRAQVHPDAVLDLLLLDESNPRSMAFQLVNILKLVEDFNASHQSYFRSTEERVILEALARLRLSSISRRELFPDPSAYSRYLTQLLDGWIELLKGFSSALSRAYFTHSKAARPLLLRS